MSHTAQFNPLPLLSVKPGISGSLEQIERDLKIYFAAPVDNQAALQAVLSEMHRVCGVLQMISLRGVAVYCGEIEKSLSELAAGTLSPTPSHHEVIQRALFALTYYLDALIDGASNATLRLFHQYQELQQARGVELSFETDLFFPELNVKLPPSVLGVPLDSDSHPRIKAARSQYQQSLLKWLRHDNPENALQNMSTAVLTVMGCVPQDQRRAFWWISAGLLDCLIHSGTPPELNVKSVLSRIDMQMKALLENNPVDAYSTTCEMLYLLARSHTVSEIVDDIKRTFSLEDYLPEESSRSPSETDQLLDQIRTLLGAARESWEKCLQDKDLQACKAFSEQIQQLRPLAEGLGRNTLQFLCNQIHTAAAHCEEPETAQRVGQDMAMALLLLEIGIDQYSHLGSNFHDQARILGQRLQSALTRAPGEEENFADMVALHSEMEKRKILGPLATEMQDNLQHVEQGLNAFFSDPSRRAELDDLGRLLHQVLAVMYLLSLDQAAQLLRSLEQAVKRYLAGNSPTPTEMRAVAIALSALEAYVQNMAHGQESDVSPLNSALQVILALQQPAPSAKPASPAASPAAAAPASAPAPAPVSAAPPATAGAEFEGDEDMLEVFLEEAREVMQSLRTNLETSFLHPESLEPLVTIRRGFHTLKGSGRMVGLADLGEVAWAAEKAMNKWLAGNKPATPSLLKFISDAEKLFQAWIDKLKKGETAFFNYAALLTTAQQIADGVELLPEQAAEPQAAPIAEPNLEPMPEAPLAQEPGFSLDLAPSPKPAPEAPLVQEPIFTLEPVAEVPPAPQQGPEPIFELNLEPLPEPIPELGPSETTGAADSKSAELVHISTQEAAQNISALQHHLADLRASNPPVVSYDFMRAAHTLGGVYRVMGFAEAANLAQALESWLQERMEKAFTLGEAQATLLEKVVATLADLVQAMGNQQEYPVPPELIAQLNTDTMLPHIEASHVPVPEPEVARAEPPAAKISMPPPVVAKPVPQSPQPEAAIARPAPPAAAISVPPPAAASPVPQPEVTIAHAEQAAADAMDERTVHDDLDEQLLPVFLEEAADLYTQISTNVQSWMEHPANEKFGQNLQRALHTLKGSARMAGAMRLGELTHITETFVDKPAARDAAFWTALQDYFDRIGNTLQLLRSGGALPGEAAEAAKAAGAPEAAQRAPGRPALEQGAGSLAAAMLRVRSDTIDFLVNEAGEISVSRSRVETEMGAVKIGLLELTNSVERLRKQLREIEIQAEAQMQARVSVLQESEQQFDPLEFDRFTQFQDLTRSMSESVHDVQTVQQTLLKSLDETSAALTIQASLNRDLQQRLMSIRTVPFSTISERLYRIIRRTGKELGKKVNLELLGGDVELDRSVLEKMTASFEHLLRNSIDHGLESAEQRVKNNKPPVGEIRLAVRQENNEVEFEFADDGAGLDIERLHKKAVEQGIFQPDEVVNEKQIMQTIFVTGLSTAKEVTEISGRGVGMDVVHSDITSLGGRIDVYSELGKGARFVIRLPLTLAVAQAILVESGHEIFALNAGMIEQVLQVKYAELVNYFDKSEVEWNGNHYPLFNLTRMLGNEEFQPESRLYNPILLLRSGERRMAVHVDELINNQEVVVKNIGPQLARLPGIAGATVLGNGKVVLILNPIALEQYASGIQKLTKAKAAAAPVTVSAAKLLVMVVDDSLTVRKVTSRMLVRAGYQVVTANDGVDALEKLAEFTPDMMLLDIEMPRMDGFELTKRLRSDPKYKDMPIIIITSRAAEKHRQYALELGVNAYLGKPYQEMELLEHVKFYSDEELRSQANFHRADALLQQIAGFISAKTDG